MHYGYLIAAVEQHLTYLITQNVLKVLSVDKDMLKMGFNNCFEATNFYT